MQITQADRKTTFPRPQRGCANRFPWSDQGRLQSQAVNASFSMRGRIYGLGHKGQVTKPGGQSLLQYKRQRKPANGSFMILSGNLPPPGIAGLSVTQRGWGCRVEKKYIRRIIEDGGIVAGPGGGGG